jgi:hypothetical protein
MSTDQRSRLAEGLSGFAANLNPLNSRTFVLALFVVGVGTWRWFRQSGEPQSNFPFYATIAASYAGGFLVGRLFRVLIKTTALVVAVVLGGLVLLNRVQVDTTKAKQAVQTGSSWAEDQVVRAKKYLLHWLPAGGVAGFGVVVGSRRKLRETIPKESVA